MTAAEARERTDKSRGAVDAYAEIQLKIGVEADNGESGYTFYSNPPEYLDYVVKRLEDDGFIVHVWYNGEASNITVNW